MIKEEFDRIREVMISQENTPEQIDLYASLFYKYRREMKTSALDLDWQNISSPEEGSISQHKTIQEPSPDETRTLLQKLSVCKLNGGLGTSMGCVGPKSAIEIREGKTFLDMIVEQIRLLNDQHQVAVPLLLMNSYNTHQDTLKIIRKYSSQVEIINFQQNEFPRLRKDTFLPMLKENHGKEATYPPGHGDFFPSIYNSNILNDLIERGKEFLFVSNADNLGATVDLKILKFLKDSKAPFVMEVTKKSRADVKGGTLIKTHDNNLCLLEIAQVPSDYKEEFKSVRKFKIFNTNNIWINLKALKQKMDEGPLNLDVIVNVKNVNDIPVIQLETAIGSGMNCFPDAKGVQVPRERFLPVKRTGDLLLVQSNLFRLQNGTLVKNKNRQFSGLPMVHLGDYFNKVDEYQKRLSSIPDILELDLLTVVGNVHFGKNVVLRGNVILVCENGELHIPPHSVLENKVLTGSIKVGEL